MFLQSRLQSPPGLLDVARPGCSSENYCLIHWEETTVLDHGKGQELLMKEALHIQVTPSEECFNRDEGLEVPGC